MADMRLVVLEVRVIRLTNNSNLGVSITMCEFLIYCERLLHNSFIHVFLLKFYDDSDRSL